MAEDYLKKAKDLGQGWKKAQQALGIDVIDSKNDYNKIKTWMENNVSSTNKSNADKAANQTIANQQPTLQTIGEGDKAVTYVSVPGDTAATISSLTDAQTRSNDRLDMIFLANQATILKNSDNAIRTTESTNQLAGTQAQAGATIAAANASAGATRFAATEAARAAIETQNIASRSQEAQIGLKGTQDRLLAVEQGAQERLNIGITGEQQRQTQAQLLAGQERQIGLTGEQQRLLAGESGKQERLTVIETGKQQRLLAGESGKQERLNISATGTEQRQTQAQLLAGQERQITLTGAQQRLLAQEQGRQQRETDLQTEQFRRYKEAKDAAQASRAFRA